MKKLIVALMILAAPAHALELQTDDAAHFGISYAINTVSYGFFSKVIGLGRVPSLIGAGLVTFGLGLGRELARPGPDSRQDMLMNSLGMAASAGTIVVFKW